MPAKGVHRVPDKVDINGTAGRTWHPETREETLQVTASWCVITDADERTHAGLPVPGAVARCIGGIGCDGYS